MTLLSENPALLQSYRRGERPALEQIYRTYVDEVATLIRLGFCSNRERLVPVSGIRERQVQCDLLQETFLRAFSPTARQGYDGVSPFRPYLLRIAKNLMIDRLRRQGRERLEGSPGAVLDGARLDALADEPASLGAPDPAELAEERRLLAATEAYVATLTEPARTFFQLRYREGRPQEEVAGRMGISRRNVRTLEDHLRDGLKKCLESQGLWERT